jgi:hypothetical protein
MGSGWDEANGKPRKADPTLACNPRKDIVGRCTCGGPIVPARRHYRCEGCGSRWRYPDDQPRTPKLGPIEFRIGEITAWRVWGIDPAGGYRSCANQYCRWAIGTIMEGDPAVLAFGVHAWKTRTAALSYGRDWFAGKAFAIGQVALWGEIIEHERGYRAQFATMTSVEHIPPPVV